MTKPVLILNFRKIKIRTTYILSKRRVDNKKMKIVEFCILDSKYIKQFSREVNKR